jgi:hypothetical protein
MQLSPRIAWCHSWVSADHLFSLYRAGGIGDILEHARLAHFPAGNVARVLEEIPNDEENWQSLLDAETNCRD